MLSYLYYRLKDTTIILASNSQIANYSLASALNSGVFLSNVALIGTQFDSKFSCKYGYCW
uniref:Uncharacterized protein n=1 Tax=Rhizophora mucronata TaxID=61149 RepID=A0A2P2NA14_RHIMU